MQRILTLSEMREVQIGILDAIDSFCRKRDLRYSLGGGTLLGAIRHGGFIPWDDDVDLMMPRPDYEIFIKEFSVDNIALQNPQNSMEAYIPFTKVYDTRTVLKEYYATNGVFVDLFPIDGLPPKNQLGEYLSEQQKIFNNLYRLHDYKYKKYLEYDKDLPRILVEFKYWLKHLTYKSKDALVEQLDSLYSQYDFETSDYAGAICGAYGEKEHMDKSVFEKYMTVRFEDKSYQCIEEYDAYLTRHYGDYMKLPPVEQQHPTHHFEVYWKD